MFRVTRQVEIALQSMLFIAQRTADGHTEPVRSHELSDTLDLPPEYTAKVVQTLARRGLLHGYAGKGGGYLLSKPPKHISVLDILEAIEGRLQLSACIDFEPGEKGVRFRTAIALELAEFRLRESLAKMTLAVLLCDCEPMDALESGEPPASEDGSDSGESSPRRRDRKHGYSSTQRERGDIRSRDEPRRWTLMKVFTEPLEP